MPCHPVVCWVEAALFRGAKGDNLWLGEEVGEFL